MKHNPEVPKEHVAKAMNEIRQRLLAELRREIAIDAFTSSTISARYLNEFRQDASKLLRESCPQFEISIR